MNDPNDIIAEISGNMSLVGYRDLRGVLALVAELDLNGMDDFNLGNMLKQQQEKTGRKPKTAARSLERVVEDIWKNGDKDVLRRIYHGRKLPSEMPKPKNLIIRIAYYEKGKMPTQKNTQEVSQDAEL